MFHISADRLCWIDNAEDDVNDLCLHGHAVAQIGTERFEYDATVSATALYLLKSLTRDHWRGKEIQMLPCCGFFLCADEEQEEVDILGCPNGIDWTVCPRGNVVQIITASGNQTFVPMELYQKEVFRFADTIEAFYQKCSEKILPTDPFDRDSYLTFWKEWHRRRGKHHIEPLADGRLNT